MGDPLVKPVFKIRNKQQRWGLARTSAFHVSFPADQPSLGGPEHHSTGHLRLRRLGVSHFSGAFGFVFWEGARLCVALKGSNKHSIFLGVSYFDRYLIFVFEGKLAEF